MRSFRLSSVIKHANNLSGALLPPNVSVLPTYQIFQFNASQVCPPLVLENLGERISWLDYRSKTGGLTLRYIGITPLEISCNELRYASTVSFPFDSLRVGLSAFASFREFKISFLFFALFLNSQAFVLPFLSLTACGPRFKSFSLPCSAWLPALRFPDGPDPNLGHSLHSTRSRISLAERPVTRYLRLAEPMPTVALACGAGPTTESHCALLAIEISEMEMDYRNT
ncbi:hypothetical protein VTK56DRAFT_9383 [Thermocarpiscus australiensis]